MAPSGGLNFVIALAGCLGVLGTMLAGSVILGRRGPASVPRYLRWLAAERPEVILEHDLAWVDSRGMKRRGGKHLVVPQIYEVELHEEGEAENLKDGTGTSWVQQGWMPIAARLAPPSLPSPSPNSSLSPIQSPKSTRLSFVSTSSTSPPHPLGASNSAQPVLLLAFLIAPPVPPRSTTLTFAPGEQDDSDTDYEIGVERVRLEGDLGELLPGRRMSSS
ncbi:hypothetical protein BDY24DRAFT_378766 [Mrakia frigida]|uniref:uncharacterized protein n=1 Tax=Mrakia frigida TaxID=29902 RepID=UPI003FCC18FD